MCNEIKKYKSWQIFVGTETFLIPPEEFDLSAKLKFIQNNGGRIYDIWPTKGQTRRICFGNNYIDNCSLTTNASLHKACLQGPVEVVTFVKHDVEVPKFRYYVFKNYACAKCNGFETTSYRLRITSGHMVSEFSIVFNFRKVSGVSKISVTTSNNCPPETFYDTNKQFCRFGYSRSRISSSGKTANEYFFDNTMV